MTEDERLRHSYIRAALTGMTSTIGYPEIFTKDHVAAVVRTADAVLEEARRLKADFPLALPLLEIRDMARNIATGRVVPGDDAKAVARHIQIIAERLLQGEPWR